MKGWKDRPPMPFSFKAGMRTFLNPLNPEFATSQQRLHLEYSGSASASLALPDAFLLKIGYILSPMAFP